MELCYRKYVLFGLIIILMSSIFPMEVPISFGVSKINDDLYEGKAKNTDVYFVMERITPKNIQFWESFIKSQWSLQKELKAKVSVRATELKDPVLKKNKEIIIGAYDGITGFDNSLKYAAWIAYASNKLITAIGQAALDNVEMAFVVMTSEGVPFLTHMGIFRSMYFIDKNLASHSGIAVDLHSFAAKVEKIVYPDKYFMITVPVAAMGDILIKKLPKSVYIGDNIYKRELEAVVKNPEGPLRIEEIGKDVSGDEKADLEYKIKQNLEAHEENIQKLAAYNKMPGLITREGDIFELKNKRGQSIFKIDQHGKEKYKWFFWHGNLTPSIYTPYTTVDLDALAAILELQPFTKMP